MFAVISDHASHVMAVISSVRLPCHIRDPVRKRCQSLHGAQHPPFTAGPQPCCIAAITGFDCQEQGYMLVALAVFQIACICAVSAAHSAPLRPLNDRAVTFAMNDH